MRRGKRLAALAAFSVLAAVLGSGTGAQANHDATLKVQVGGKILGVPGESMRFLGARSINVHRGDQVEFTITGSHTATLLPTNVSAQDWLDANYGPDKAYYPILADDEAGEYIDNFGSIDEPTDAACGNAGEPNCRFAGTEVLNSGSRFAQAEDEAPANFTFTVEINAAPGERIWVVCLAHPHMRMKINVVDNQTATTTQQEIDTAEAAQIAQDADWAEATHNKMKARRSSHVGADGKRVWDAWAGVDNHYASLTQFYPRKLVLKKGQTVRWRFDTMVYEDHTVSLPIPTIFERLQFGHGECDPGAGPDTQATPSDPNDPFSEPVCPEGSTVEFEFDEFLTTTGDQVLRGGDDYEHSGVRGANVTSSPLAGVESYDVRFARRSGERPIQYLCFLHENMVGKIVVK